MTEIELHMEEMVISDRCEWDLDTVHVAAVVTLKLFNEEPYQPRTYLKKINVKDLQKPQESDIYLLLRLSVRVGLDRVHYDYWAITDGESIYGVEPNYPKSGDIDIAGPGPMGARPIMKDEKITSRKNLSLFYVSNFSTGPYISDFIHANITRTVKRFLERKLGKYLGQ
jgi:hypothetical protein